MDDFNEVGNNCYRNGNFDQAIAYYSKAMEVLLKTAPSSSQKHVQYLANRCQAKIQQRNYSLALEDADCALAIDGRNTKVLLRRSIILENLDQFHRALVDVQTALRLGGLSTSMLQYALKAKVRLKQNAKLDKIAAVSESQNVGTLVHDQQALRINFSNPFPSCIVLSTWYPVTLFLSNEFGLFKKAILHNTQPISLALTLHSNSPSHSFQLDVQDPYGVEELHVPSFGESGKTSFKIRVSGAANSSIENERLWFKVAIKSECIIQQDILSVVSLPFTVGSDINSRPMDSNVLGVHCCRSVSINGYPKEILLAESPGLLGIGGKLWDSSLILTEYLAKNSFLVEAKKVIELGSGLGLVGICCYLLGSQVVLTDMEDVVQLLKYNITLNLKMSDCNRIDAIPFMWGSNSEGLNPPVEVVLMSDVVYDPVGYQPLIKSLLDLSNKDTVIIMAHRSRHPQDHEFFDDAKKHFEILEITRSFEDKSKGKLHDVKLLQFHRIQ